MTSQIIGIFIILPNGETVLIDAGENANSRDTLRHIKDNGENTLDYVIVTHPHVDHMGGMAEVIKAFKINIMGKRKMHY